MLAQLRNIVRGGLRDAYVSVLNETLPEELARCLAWLTPEAPRIAVEGLPEREDAPSNHLTRQ